MARYTGPKVKISRRLGVNIFENRPQGQREAAVPAGRARTVAPPPAVRVLDAAAGEAEGQAHLRPAERQFENLYKEATRAKGVTGENLLRFLEQRLDNIVFRAGWARTRPQARQFVNHGLIDVNGRRVDIPSYRVKKGDVVTLRAKSQAMIVIQHNLDTLDGRLPAWIESGDGGKSVTVRELPLASRSMCPCESSSSSSCTPSSPSAAPQLTR